MNRLEYVESVSLFTHDTSLNQMNLHDPILFLSGMNRSVGLVPSSGPSTSGIGGGMGGSSLSSLSSGPSASTSTNIPEGRTHVTKVSQLSIL